MLSYTKKTIFCLSFGLCSGKEQAVSAFPELPTILHFWSAQEQSCFVQKQVVSSYISVRNRLFRPFPNYSHFCILFRPGTNLFLPGTDSVLVRNYLCFGQELYIYIFFNEGIKYEV